METFTLFFDCTFNDEIQLLSCVHILAWMNSVYLNPMLYVSSVVFSHKPGISKHFEHLTSILLYLSYDI